MFLHISTAYSNSDRQVVEEVLYPAPANIDEIRQLVKEDLSDEDTLKIIGNKSFTILSLIERRIKFENVNSFLFILYHLNKCVVYTPDCRQIMGLVKIFKKKNKKKYLVVIFANINRTKPIVIEVNSGISTTNLDSRMYPMYWKPFAKLFISFSLA